MTIPNTMRAVMLTGRGGHYCPEVKLEAVNGHINLPAGHGLGITPDEVIIGDPTVEF
jgi:hypothetical protein